MYYQINYIKTIMSYAIKDTKNISKKLLSNTRHLTSKTDVDLILSISKKNMPMLLDTEYDININDYQIVGQHKKETDKYNTKYSNKDNSKILQTTDVEINGYRKYSKFESDNIDNTLFTVPKNKMIDFGSIKGPLLEEYIGRWLRHNLNSSFKLLSGIIVTNDTDNNEWQEFDIIIVPSSTEAPSKT